MTANAQFGGERSWVQGPGCHCRRPQPGTPPRGTQPRAEKPGPRKSARRLAPVQRHPTVLLRSWGPFLALSLTCGLHLLPAVWCPPADHIREGSLRGTEGMPPSGRCSGPGRALQASLATDSLPEWHKQWGRLALHSHVGGRVPRCVRCAEGTDWNEPCEATRISLQKPVMATRELLHSLSGSKRPF